MTRCVAEPKSFYVSVSNPKLSSTKCPSLVAAIKLANSFKKKGLVADWWTMTKEVNEENFYKWLNRINVAFKDDKEAREEFLFWTTPAKKQKSDRSPYDHWLLAPWTMHQDDCIH